MMNTILKKLKRSFRYYYYSQKNEWYFPSNVAHLSGEQMACGSYEPQVSNKITENLKDGDIFIDVGANVGYFSRLASQIVGLEGAVYAFEAEAENYHALSQNINDYSNINALHFAVSNDNAFITVNHSSHSACHSMVNTDNLLDGGQFSVPTITLDHFWKIYLKKKTIQLLKIDVEGAELMVLNGMDTLLSEDKINTMIIEFCPVIIKNAGFQVTNFYQKIAPFFSISIIDTQYKPVVKNGIINSISDLKTISNQLLKENRSVNINLLCQKK